MPRKRVAVIDRDMCIPQPDEYLCKRICPINRSGAECVTVGEDTKPLINEELCITCGICVKKCPKHAISVLNLPARLDEDPIHRYGKNMFSLYRLPVPKRQAVVGLIGPNGMGKSTVLSVLSGRFRPNCGNDKAQSWDDVISRFRGTELQDYLKRLAGGSLSAAYKPQNVDAIPSMFKGNVNAFLKKAGGDAKGIESVTKRLRIDELLSREVAELSGGELQLLAVAATLLKDKEFYFFDEPSSYLDIFGRLLVANEIRALAEKKIVMIVEHDMALLDYLTDYVHVLYGEAGAFGIVSPPYGVRVGINAFLDGYIKEDNVRFRKEAVVFSRAARSFGKSSLFMPFPELSKSFKSFSLTAEGGSLYKGEVIGILGPNAIGKSTFIKMLAGEVDPDEGQMPKLSLAYKPQRMVIGDDDEGMAQDFIRRRAGGSHGLKSVISSLGIERLMERDVSTLSGGELQACFIAAALGKEADLTLMDEPSAFLDVEQRLKVAKLIRQQAEEHARPFFVVDHDLLFIDAISDRLMLFSGSPGKKGHGQAPMQLEDGMNSFLRILGITYRRDPQTGRPRINKPGSQKDAEQKSSGKYYYA